MTLIIGIKCQDGIAMGADGAATLGSLAERTIIQPVRKLEIISECVVFGNSGHVGLGQRYRGDIQDLWKENKLSGKEPHQAMKILRDKLWENGEKEWACARATQPVIGPVAAIATAACSTMIGLPLKRSLHLFHFDHQCSPEEATDSLPFVAIGSGQKIADPFLAFLRRIFWEDKVPTLSEGIFATLWTLDHAIRTNPGGVAEPVQIITLSRDPQKNWKAIELSKEDLKEHYEAIAAAEGTLRGFRNSIKGKTEGDEDLMLPKPA